jgi:peroxiredoxin
MKTKITILGIVIAVVITSIVLIEQKRPEKVVFEDSDTGLSIGKTAPNFELDDISGKKVQLNDFRGKPILLNFWASWCAPCRIEMPEFQEIYDTNQELVIIGVNLQEDRENIVKFTDKFAITFPILLDPDSEVKSMYNIFTQPVTYFIDGNGKIIDKKFGPLTIEEINEKINKIV